MAMGKDIDKLLHCHFRLTINFQFFCHYELLEIASQCCRPTLRKITISRFRLVLFFAHFTVFSPESHSQQQTTQRIHSRTNHLPDTPIFTNNLIV